MKKRLVLLILNAFFVSLFVNASGPGTYSSKKELINGIYYCIHYYYHPNMGAPSGEFAEVISKDVGYSGSIVLPEYVVCDLESDGTTAKDVKIKVKEIRQFAFLNCTGLKSISIPKTVEYISPDAFEGCINLEAIYVDEDNKNYSAENNCLLQSSGLYLLFANRNSAIPNKTQTICGGTFQHEVKGDGTYYDGDGTPLVFKGEYGAFKNCNDLVSVIIPENVKYINSHAFSGCVNLTNITCQASLAPKVYSDTFASSAIENISLYVPGPSIADYKKTAFWNNFKEILAIPGTELFKLSYVVDGNVYKSYEIKEGDEIDPEPEPTKDGYTFSGWSEIPEEMPAHDVTVTGTFIKDPLGTCAAPTISVVGGKLTFACETEGVTYHYDVSCTYEKSGEGNNIDLQPVYKVSVYASKDGFVNSETVAKDIKLDNAAKGSGDSNGDGVVNAADIVTIVNTIMQGGQ